MAAPPDTQHLISKYPIPWDFDPKLLPTYSTILSPYPQLCQVREKGPAGTNPDQKAPKRGLATRTAPGRIPSAMAPELHDLGQVTNFSVSAVLFVKSG